MRFTWNRILTYRLALKYDYEYNGMLTMIGGGVAASRTFGATSSLR